MARNMLLWSHNFSIYIKRQYKHRNLHKKLPIKRMLPLYRSHNTPPLFWPDLASCHYSARTLQQYSSNKIKFIPKNQNSPNCPQLRPVEKFWAIVKQSLLKNGKVTKSVNQMKSNWKKAVEKVREDGVKRLMGGIKKKASRIC